ncbi:type IX secretion system plug protein domain-containing protein [Melioribacter sp. Ez-97]|uniref:type IX secretion system plug protein n=1 Tax=Melioribacter sp. Ez-97 TaxID=3423434 RepID=UPI003ED9C405
MRRNILIFFLLLCGVIDAAYFDIKSLKVYSTGDETSFPLIDAKAEPKQTITIEFDVDSDSAPNLNIIFRFCDKNWKPYEDAFLLNQRYNTEYYLNFQRLPLHIEGARYHYAGVFPNKNVTFPFSGKWKFYIVDSYDPAIVFAEGNFYVVYPEIKPITVLHKERFQGNEPDIPALARTISINTEFRIPDSLYPSEILGVEIIENRKIGYPVIIDPAHTDDERFYEWNGNDEFKFIARNIRPGNEYRQTDLRDYNIYNAKEVYAQFDGIETSDFFHKRKKDLNGGSILTNYKSDYAEYLYVTFRIRPPEDIQAPVYLTGAFNNWRILPDYEMYDDNGLLYLTLELKRGIYDYQYVTAYDITQPDWYILEGNFWETVNEYHIFIYYKSQEYGSYHKIIGYNKIISVNYE